MGCFIDVQIELRHGVSPGDSIHVYYTYILFNSSAYKLFYPPRDGAARKGAAVTEAVIAGVGILIGLNGAILAYVISIERRLTRLETFQEIRRAAAAAERTM